jgi:hypothetical protein
MDQNSKLQSAKPNAALKDLAPLMGEWNTVGTHPGFPAPVSGHSTFEWLEHRSLLVWHFNWEKSGPPNAISVIGHDDSAENYVMLYSDERGVARIYQISLKGQVWKMWRDSPNFSQRLTGIISDDGNTITSHGELSRDGSNWERDLDVTYTKER